MRQLTLLQAAAYVQGAKDLLDKDWFDICQFDTLVKLGDIKDSISGEDYLALRAVHCTHWHKMDPRFRTMLRAKILEILNVDAFIQEPETPLAKVVNFFRKDY